MENNTQHDSSVMSNFLNALCLLDDLQIKSEALLNKNIVTSDRAKYHLRYGLNRRLAIITKNLEFFYHTIPPTRQTPLDVNEISLASVHINSLYIHLYGVIDNIGWTLAYEFNLYIENVTQNYEINLFQNTFLQKLEKINSHFEEYKKYLNTKKSWYRDLAEFRHPSAHRIPLYVPPSILNKSESDKYIYHHSQHLEEAHKLKFKKADEHFNQIISLGTFIPLFAHDPDVEPSPIYPVIITDCKNLAEITLKFLASLEQSSEQR